jgi:hypothetical protein
MKEAMTLGKQVMSYVTKSPNGIIVVSVGQDGKRFHLKILDKSCSGNRKKNS